MAKKFKVAITNTETQIFTVEAQDSAEAVERISNAWDERRIELDNPGLCDTDFSLIGRAEA
ncbi:MAG: hypothetical protein II876_00135 [Synergistaceae bacterium]|nr:hypothetical protein [Synergistaceae bacterium]MBQ6114507.1 hypothetical protein [Synergistaceae bacterium]MBR0184806.1 hypothetical protein [Synergistaceae bacterium]MBR0279212.1 hypothetical protein [Synergistaceae bacterium]